jgi:thiol-disulfide isomerase/thioredoxin
MPSSSKSFLKTSFKSISSSKRSKDDSSSTILVSIALLLFIIITGTIIYNSYNREKFTSNQPNKLVYLYMENCGFCKEFNKVWEEMEKEDLTKYKININKFDLNNEGKELANANSINYAPAIILITPNKHFLYEGERTKLEIFKWVSTKV